MNYIAYYLNFFYCYYCYRFIKIIEFFEPFIVYAFADSSYYFYNNYHCYYCDCSHFYQLHLQLIQISKTVTANVISKKTNFKVWFSHYKTFHKKIKIIKIYKKNLFMQENFKIF